MDLVVAEVGGEPHAHRHGPDMVIGLRPQPIPRATALSKRATCSPGIVGREPFKQSRHTVHGLLPGVLTLMTDVADGALPVMRGHGLYPAVTVVARRARARELVGASGWVIHVFPCWDEGCTESRREANLSHGYYLQNHAAARAVNVTIRPQNARRACRSTPTVLS